MNRHLAGIWAIMAATLLAASMVGCAPPRAAGTLLASPKAVKPQASSPSASPATEAPEWTPTGTVASSPAPALTTSPALVNVVAKGNLFIRRGPDLAFNPISVLLRGQTAFPTGRDVLARWLRIPLPGDPSKSGWISIMSHFTEVTGDVRSLTEIEPSEWPRLASLRNCTYHQMRVQPVGLTIPSVQFFPDNDVRLNPGSYAVLDADVDDYPEVLSVEIKEGSAVDIVVDGDGERKKCPAP
ncbi:MAG: hypothetical protein V1755_11940 [Chloroflexota bacterium]